MKIGVISDIHGDANALTQALERLDRIHGVDRLLCAGDLVGRGPSPEAVVAIIRARQIPTVQGNHDGWAYSMPGDQRSFLAALPLDWRGEQAGVRLYMTHGKPGNNMWGLYPEHLSSEFVNIMLAELEADVLITGHTHQPMVVSGNGCMVVNPGSLYLFPSGRPSSATYGVLSLPDKRFEIFSLLESPYVPLTI
ncbi:MAG: YfcE family phosphodiesterase [Anaerolineae bacterium]|nr:YfcE family phosphodiesterase [Anaerolineae bacterium]